MTAEINETGQEAANHHDPDGGTTKTSNSPECEGKVAGKAKCSICQSTFRRPEHLKRHLRSHTKEKPFECARCGRHFSRTDTLHRHELSHHSLGSDGGRDRAHRITVRTFRACFGCAVARVRCSGGAPCARCDNRSLECQYPTERRSKAKAIKEASQKLLVSKRNESPLQNRSQVSTSPDDIGTPSEKADMASSSQPAGHQMTRVQSQLDGLSTSRMSPETQANPAFKETIDRQSENLQAERLLEAGNFSRRLPLPSAGEPTNFLFPPSSSQRIHPNIPATAIRGPFSVDPATGHGHQMRGFQSGVAGSNVDIQMGTAANEQMQMEIDQPFFNQSMISKINWLSTDLFPDTPNGQSLSSGPSPLSNQHTLVDSSLVRTAWLPTAISAEQVSQSFPENTSQLSPGNISQYTDGRSSGYTHAINERPPHPGSYDETLRSRDYYVDGPDATFRKHGQEQGPLPTSSAEPLDTHSHQKNDVDYLCAFPVIPDIRLSNVFAEEVLFNRQIEASMYEKIHHCFLQLCCMDNFLFPKFESGNFPNAQVLTSFVRFYFASFQPVYPIFHHPTFDPNKCHWLVTLAVSAIGCHFSHVPETAQTRVAFHEFLRRAIYVEKEKCRSGRIPLWLLQAMLLNCIGLLYSGCERDKLSALNSFGDLINLMNAERLLHPSHNPQPSSTELPQEEQWTIWIEGEVRRRTGYCIWLVDCTLAYHFDSRPLLCLDDGQAALPCHENIWKAKFVEAWRQLFDKSSGRVSLYEAVHDLYIEKKLASDIGEFGYILLIHALYHRMWEVGDYFRRPLSFWNPTAKKQSRESAIPSGSVWLPGIPSYSKWRNSACDCLDILQWSANSSIFKAPGLGRPIALHLHVARIVLLTPFREIRSLATLLAMGKIRWIEHQRALEWHYIRRWIKHDQYKARLAVVHAGTILWRIRLYPTHAFHEPVAVFLAVLTLWAYGSCHAQVSNAHTPSQIPPPYPSYEIIHLDRPCDDEFVQRFVRDGQTIKAGLTGVGDLCASPGPERVLQVGCEILSGLTSWGISGEFVVILTKLAELASGHSTMSN